MRCLMRRSIARSRSATRPWPPMSPLERSTGELAAAGSAVKRRRTYEPTFAAWDVYKAADDALNAAGRRVSRLVMAQASRAEARHETARAAEKAAGPGAA